MNANYIFLDIISSFYSLAMTWSTFLSPLLQALPNAGLPGIRGAAGTEGLLTPEKGEMQKNH